MTRRKKVLSTILSLSMLCSGCTLGQRTDKEEQAEFVIREIFVNRDTKSMQVTADYFGDDTDNLELYVLAGMEVLDVNVRPKENSKEIVWTGFYEEESDCERIEIQSGFSSTEEPAVLVESIELAAEPEFVEAKRYETAAGSGNATVWVTPFSVVIRPSENWREEGRLYAVLASDTQGNCFYVSQLPVMDDREHAEQKEHPLTDAVLEGREKTDIWSMPQLGENAGRGSELDNYGFRFVTEGKIELETLDQVQIVPYVFE